jgi:hypothetical protein
MTMLLTLLIDDTIHGTINLIVNAEDVNTVPVVITAATVLEPETVTIRLISPVLYTRNLIAVHGNTHLRNKTLRRLDLRHETSIDLTLKHATPVTSKSVSVTYTYSM